MNQVSRLLKTEGYELIKDNEQTQTYRYHDLFLKVYLGKDAQERYHRELTFYLNNTSKHIPLFVESILIETHPAIVTKFLPDHGIGFISDDEAGMLEISDFELIYNAIHEIQRQGKTNILIHNDLAPHNLYLNGSKIVISDWDHYSLESNVRLQMYDFATLWYWLYVEEERLSSMFTQHIKKFLVYEGMFDNFKYCYKKILDNAKKIKEHHLTRGTVLRENILKSF